MEQRIQINTAILWIHMINMSIHGSTGREFQTTLLLVVVVTHRNTCRNRCDGQFRWLCEMNKGANDGPATLFTEVVKEGTSFSLGDCKQWREIVQQWLFNYKWWIKHNYLFLIPCRGRSRATSTADRQRWGWRRLPHCWWPDLTVDV